MRKSILTTTFTSLLLFSSLYSHPATAEPDTAPYRIAVMVNLAAERPIGSNRAEIADDLGFYLSEAKDDLVQHGINVIPPNETPRRVPIINQGRTLRYLNVYQFLPKGECCGFIVLQNNRPARFIALRAQGTAKMVMQSFRE